MFDTIAARGRTKSRVLAYLLNVDVVGHLGGLDQAVAMLVEIDRRIRVFKADHRRRFQFTLFADHGNAHQRSLLVDPAQILTDVGVTSVDALSPATAADATAAPPLEAVAVVHVRVNYVALHAARHNVAEIAARTSRHPYVDLAVARLADDADGAQRVRRLAAGRPPPLQPGRRGDHRRRRPGRAGAGWASTSARGATTPAPWHG